MLKLRNIWQQKTGLTQSLITVIGNFGVTGLAAVALILTTRFLGPEKFGVFSVGFAISLMVVRINDLGLNTVLVKLAAGNDQKKIKNLIYSLITRYKIYLSLGLVLIGLIFSHQLAVILNFNHDLVLMMAFIFGLSTVYYEHLLAILQSTHRFTHSVIVNLIQAAIKLLGVIFLLLFHQDQVYWVFALFLLAPAVPAAMARLFLPSWVKINLQAQDNKIKRKIISLAKHTSIALISAGIIENIDVLFVQRNLSDFETGLYGGVGRIAMMFSLVAYSLGSVLNARVARYRDAANLRKFVRKAVIIAILALVGFAVFIPFAKLLIWLTIGPQYYGGLSILLILTAASFLTIAAIPFMALFFSFDANWYFSFSGLLQLAIILFGNYFFVPVYGLAAAAWVRLAARLALFIFTLTSGLYLYRQKLLAEK